MFLKFNDFETNHDYDYDYDYGDCNNHLFPKILPLLVQDFETDHLQMDGEEEIDNYKWSGIHREKRGKRNILQGNKPLEEHFAEEEKKKRKYEIEMVMMMEIMMMIAMVMIPMVIKLKVY